MAYLDHQRIVPVLAMTNRPSLVLNHHTLVLPNARNPHGSTPHPARSAELLGSLFFPDGAHAHTLSKPNEPNRRQLSRVNRLGGTNRSLQGAILQQTRALVRTTQESTHIFIVGHFRRSQEAACGNSSRHPTCSTSIAHTDEPRSPGARHGSSPESQTGPERIDTRPQACCTRPQCRC